jgi:hypothetical protein
MISDIDIHVLYPESFNDMVEGVKEGERYKFVTQLIKHLFYDYYSLWLLMIKNFNNCNIYRSK